MGIIVCMCLCVYVSGLICLSRIASSVVCVGWSYSSHACRDFLPPLSSLPPLTINLPYCCSRRRKKKKSGYNVASIGAGNERLSRSRSRFLRLMESIARLGSARNSRLRSQSRETLYVCCLGVLINLLPLLPDNRLLVRYAALVDLLGLEALGAQAGR